VLKHPSIWEKTVTHKIKKKKNKSSKVKYNDNFELKRVKNYKKKKQELNYK